MRLFSKNKNNLRGGYMGLLMLLIGVAIMAFLIVRTDLFTGQKGSKNMIERGTDAIDSAQEAKDLIEENSRRSAEY